MTAIESLGRARRATARSLGVFLRDVGHGLLEISHNTLALLGLAVVAVALFATGKPDLRHQAEQQALGWLQDREAQALESGDVLSGVAEQLAVTRATIDPATCQATGRRGVVSRRRGEPIARLVQEAGRSANARPSTRADPASWR
jgi:hypothetical protein